MSQSSTIVWFRNDLRISDNQAIREALELGLPTHFIYILDDTIPWSLGTASKQWLYNSLLALGQSLEKRGAMLTLLKGDTCHQLRRVVKHTSSTRVLCHKKYEPAEQELEQHVSRMLAKQNAHLTRYTGYLLVEPDIIQTKQGKAYQVFTPFWAACEPYINARPPLKAPQNLSSIAPEQAIPGLKLDDLGLLESTSNVITDWKPGEKGALAALKAFVASSICEYSEERDFPAQNACSRLSPHLHFGEISPRQVLSAIASEPALTSNPSAYAYKRQLGWREFSHYSLVHSPEMPEQPLRSKYAKFWPKAAPNALKSWKNGQTGIPLVDAGMRELLATGFIHNRVRMVVASFLVKNLLISWKEGQQWFWDTLVDANLANNACSWQWVAGCGLDAAPYFRIFNPVTQASKFDPHCEYITTWVPELKKLPSKYAAAPWTLPPELAQQFDFMLGRDYPTPIVDLAQSRQMALQAHTELSRRKEQPA